MASPLPPDPYAALGLAKDATSAAIKTAYRKLALKSHPDKFPDPAQKAEKAAEFHKVQQAYEILGDDDKRERYNAQVRLAELRKEAMERQSARGGTKAETRTATYDVRTPSGTTTYTTRAPSKTYDESRRSTYDDDDRVYEETRVKKTTAKYAYPSGRRNPTPPRSGRERFKIFVDPRATRAKTRDQDKRKERVSKYAPSHVDSDDSDERARYEERRREAQQAAMFEEEERRRNAERFTREAEAQRREAERRRADEERDAAARRSSRSRKEDAHTEDAYHKWDAKQHEAMEYIKRSARGASTSADEGRPTPTRSSTGYATVRSKGPDRPRTVRRSSEKEKEKSRILSGIRHGRGSREKDRRDTMPDIVELEDDRDPRRPGLEKSDSSPAAMRAAAASARGGVERSATMDSYDRPRESPGHPAMRRAETMPTQTSAQSSRREKNASNTSKLRTEMPKHMHDSGYSSPNTPTNSNSDRERDNQYSSQSHSAQPHTPQTRPTMTTKMFSYRYPETSSAGGVPLAKDDSSYNTVTVEPPSGDERDRDHRKRSHSRERVRSSGPERDQRDDRGREHVPGVRNVPAPTTTRYAYETVSESRRPTVTRTTSYTRSPEGGVREHEQQPERSREHIVLEPRGRERTRDRDRDHELDYDDYTSKPSKPSLYGEIPKHAGEPLKTTRPSMRRGESYTPRSDVRYAPKFGPEDVNWAPPRSRERTAADYDYYSRPPMPTRNNTAVY